MDVGIVVLFIDLNSKSGMSIPLNMIITLCKQGSGSNLGSFYKVTLANGS